MEKVKHFVKKARYSYRGLPDKKQYVEFFTAILTVPVLLTVIILNLNNLRANNKANQPTPAPVAPKTIVVTVPVANQNENSNFRQTQISPEVCKKGIGPISIDFPEESAVVTDNPIQVDIQYHQGSYCAVVWAYNINGGKFSDFDDKSIALYNPPQGTITLQLKVKSIVTGEQKVLTRTFTYSGSNTQSATSSAQ